MSMEIYNIYNQIEIKADISLNNVKKIKDNIKNLNCYKNFYSSETISVPLSDFIDIDTNTEYDGLTVSLLPNKEVTYLNNCIPNTTKEFIFANIIQAINLIFDYSNNIGEIKGEITFNTSENDSPEYMIKSYMDNNSIINFLYKKKNVEDYKKIIEYMINIIEMNDGIITHRDLDNFKTEVISEYKVVFKETFY